MKLICAVGREGVCILRCFGYDGQVEIPEKIQGKEVREIGAYAFADIVRRRQSGVKYLVQVREDISGEDADREAWEWEECQEDLLDLEALEDGTPVICARNLQSVSLV